MTSTDRLSTTAAPESLWERRRRLVSIEIERIAVSEFATFGYENVTIEQIAKAAGITIRTFYRYFTSKEDLLLAMPRRVTAHLAEAVRARPPQETILDSYRHTLAAHADATIDDEHIALQWRGIFRQSAELPWMVSHHSVIEGTVAVIAERMGVDARKDPRPEVIAGAISGTLDVALAHWLASGGKKDRQALMLNALDVLESIGTLGGAPVTARRSAGPARSGRGTARAVKSRAVK